MTLKFLDRAVAALGVATGLALCAAPWASHAQSFGTAAFLARISSTGTVFSSNGVSGATRPATGSYQVTFTRPLTSCYFSVSVTGTGPSFANATISTNNPNLLFVRTYNGAGNPVNAQFNVVILCGP